MRPAHTPRRVKGSISIKVSRFFVNVAFVHRNVTIVMLFGIQIFDYSVVDKIIEIDKTVSELLHVLACYR